MILFAFLFLVSTALSQTPEIHPGQRVSDSVKEGEVKIVKVKTTGTKLDSININWLMEENFNFKDAQRIPKIEIFTVSSSGESTFFVALNEEIMERLDEPFWPVVTQGKKEFEVKITGPLTFTILSTDLETMNAVFGSSFVGTIPGSRSGTNIIVDLKQNDLKNTDKVAIELFMCSGVLEDVEIMLYNVYGTFNKYRKDNMKGKVMHRPFLIPIQISDASAYYKIDLFKPNNVTEEVVFRARLIKLSKDTLVNLVAMHQMLENVDYPNDLKLEHHLNSTQLAFNLELDPYLLGLNKIESPSSYSMILESSKKDPLMFRLMCSVDTTIFKGDYKTPALTSKKLTESKGKYTVRQPNHHIAAKRVLYFNGRTHVAWSRIVSPQSFASVVFGQSSDRSTNQGSTMDYRILGLVVLIIISAILLIWAIKEKNKLNIKAKEVKDASVKRKIASNEETKKLTDESKEVELSDLRSHKIKERTKGN